MRVEVLPRRQARSRTARRRAKACSKSTGGPKAGHYEAVFPRGRVVSRAARCAAHGAVPRRRDATASASRIPSSTTTCRSSARRGAIHASAAAPEPSLEAYLLDWLTLLVRWAHIVVGIAWIGASFYFIWLDNHLEAGKGPGVRGRAVRDPRRRLLPRAEVPARARRAAEDAALVQVGGVLDLDHRASCCSCWSTTSTPSFYLIDPAVMKLSTRRGDRHRARQPGCRACAVYEGLCRSPLSEMTWAGGRAAGAFWPCSPGV